MSHPPRVRRSGFEPARVVGARQVSALGLFLFDSPIPSKLFVPRGLRLPWHRAVDVAFVSPVDMPALAAALRATGRWEMGSDGTPDKMVMTHVQWGVSVVCWVDLWKEYETTLCGGAGCVAERGLVATESVVHEGRSVLVPAPLEDYLLWEHWEGYAHGLVSIPLDHVAIRRAVKEGSRLLWRARVDTLHTMRGIGPGNVLTLLQAWQSGNSIALDGPARMLHNWARPACQGFCACADSPSSAGIRRLWGQRQVGLTCTEEGGDALPRRQSKHSHRRHKVYINHQFKFVFVQMPKSASSSVHATLSKAFGRHYDRSERREAYSNPQECYVEDEMPSAHIGGPTSCLTREILSDYFFFTFLRDPHERFFSSLKQAVHQGNLAGMVGDKGNFSASHILLDMMDGVVFDSHLEQQVKTLGCTVPLSGSAAAGIPWDFLGRVSHLAQDFMELWDALARFTAERGVNDTLPAVSLEHLRADGTPLNQGGGIKATVQRKLLGNDPVEAEMVHDLLSAVHEHELTCFPELHPVPEAPQGRLAEQSGPAQIGNHQPTTGAAVGQGSSHATGAGKGGKAAFDTCFEGNSSMRFELPLQGRWVPDDTAPAYWNLSCPLEMSKYSCARQGRVAHAVAARLRFEPADCMLGEPDEAELASALRGRKVHMVGDSLIREVFIALACLLGAPAQRATVEWAQWWPNKGFLHSISSGQHSGFMTASAPLGSGGAALTVNEAVPAEDDGGVVVVQQGVQRMDVRAAAEELADRVLELRRRGFQVVWLPTPPPAFPTVDGEWDSPTKRDWAETGQADPSLDQHTPCRPDVEYPRLQVEEAALRERGAWRELLGVVALGDIERCGRAKVGWGGAVGSGRGDQHYCMPGVPDQMARVLVRLLVEALG